MMLLPCCLRCYYDDIAPPLLLICQLLLPLELRHTLLRRFREVVITAASRCHATLMMICRRHAVSILLIFMPLRYVVDATAIKLMPLMPCH